MTKMADVLDGEYESVTEAAEDALDVAMSIIESKAKFTVVAQVVYPEQGDKVALSWYGTEKQGLTHALQLTHSAQTHEDSLAWVLPVHHGTPNDWFKARKAESKALDPERVAFRERELKRRIEWLEDNPDELIPDDWPVEVGATSDTEECDQCQGVGRVYKDEIARRGELAASQREENRA